jgi:adenylate cyclase
MAEGSERAKVSRRLAAILAADIAGYSALMGADEEATVRELKAHQAIILPMVGEHGGRIIDTAGDGILAEFASVVNAVECALAIQKTMADRNAGTDPERRMQFRIGVSLGDVIHDEQRVYGDGVNIAARLESIVEPGGICLSGEAFGQVQRRLPLSAVDLGDQQLKNIVQPVRVYRVATDHISAPQAAAKPALALPDMPSIAVLPFTNLSGDPKEDYFSDGITEDIITELSRFSELFVIARNSSFQYKAKSPDIRQVGRELGVRYVLEGSIRRAGDRVRITAQLVDASTGAHRWAERYDRELKDIFAVQDEVARTIVSILAAHVRKAEIERTRAKPPNNWKAYDCYLQAADSFIAFNTSFSAKDLNETRRLLQQSLALDGSYARSYALLAHTHEAAWVNPVDSDFLNPGALEEAHRLARKAVQLDPNLPEAHAILGAVLTWKRQHEASLIEIERTIALNPNYLNWRFGLPFVVAGRSRRAVEILGAQMRLDPFYPPAASAMLGLAHYMLKEYAQALPALRDCVSRAPDLRAGHVGLAVAYAKLGQMENAHAEVAEVLRVQPNFTISGTMKQLVSFKAPEDDKHYFEGLRKAGLPE